jgi:putative N-acetylmannosamine-6-phosphate epimerase
VLAAGSIDRPERVRAVCDADVWAFTIGSALFEGRFAGNLLEQQIRSLVQMQGVSK